jgi:alkanesulfonate monooxygenase SsuD/methylene tetrahydromethanopterin reductase-like flavin-dependent oxidoreductase (luciferase family)
VRTPNPIVAVKETVDIVSRFLRGDKTEYKGMVFRISEGMTFRYEPYRREIPIFIGTWGRKLSQVAGQMKEVSEVRIDTLWNPSYLPVISKAIAYGARRAGRNPSDVRIAVGPQTSISRDREAARKCVRKTLPDYMSYPPFMVMASAVGVDSNEIDAVRQATRKNDYESAENLISDHTIDNFTASGTPEDIIRGAKIMIDHGASHISFCHPHGPNVQEAIHLIGREVIPSLKQ